MIDNHADAVHLEHFGLTEPPFRQVPDGQRFFDGAARGEVLRALVHALVHEDGFVMVTGAIGSGKTTLSRVLMGGAAPGIDFLYMVNPSIRPQDVLDVIADELGLPVAQSGSRAASLRFVQRELIDRHARGRQVVLLVDEAQAMPIQSLQEIRLLSNLETGARRLLQVVLVGQPELYRLLEHPRLRPLRERVVQRFELEPMSTIDVDRYLSFRMRAAGAGASIFDPDAVVAIADASCGLARRVNVLADKSLMSAYVEGSRVVGTVHVRAAMRDAWYQFGLDDSRPTIRGGVAGTARDADSGLALGSAARPGWARLFALLKARPAALRSDQRDALEPRLAARAPST